MRMPTKTGVAVAAIVALATLALPMQAAQAPKAGATDLKSTLFKLANSLGMLRTLEQVDLIVTQEVWAKGTITMAGQPSQVTDYRASINYVIPGLREDVSYTTAAAPAKRQIRVVAQEFAWDETERGMNPTAAKGAARERLVQLWTTPVGVVKAATAAGDRAKLAVEGGSTVVTFPLPAPVNDVVAKATLRSDASLLATKSKFALPGLVGTYIVRVETLAPIATETTYSEYGDWNWDDYKSDVMLPRRITHKRADGTVLDLTVVNTNTYNPYVIMPVPESVRTAGTR